MEVDTVVIPLMGVDDGGDRDWVWFGKKDDSTFSYFYVFFFPIYLKVNK